MAKKCRSTLTFVIGVLGGAGLMFFVYPEVRKWLDANLPWLPFESDTFNYGNYVPAVGIPDGSLVYVD